MTITLILLEQEGRKRGSLIPHEKSWWRKENVKPTL